MEVVSELFKIWIIVQDLWLTIWVVNKTEWLSLKLILLRCCLGGNRCFLWTIQKLSIIIILVRGFVRGLGG